jgi:hypothetical protein
MIASIVGSQSHSNFVSYMQVVKKPAGMTVPEFVERMLLLFRYSVYLLTDDGGEPDPTTELQQRRYIVKAFPEPWITNLTNAGLSAARSTIPEIIDYMQNQASMETQSTRKRSNTYSHYGSEGSNTRRIRGGGGFRDRNTTDGGGYNRSGRSGRGGRGGRAGRSGRGGERGGRNRPNPDDNCPFPGHHGHKWRKCIYNPNKDADAPTYTNRRDQRNGQQHQHPPNQHQNGAYFIVNPSGAGGSQQANPSTGAPTQFYYSGMPSAGVNISTNGTNNGGPSYSSHSPNRN